MKRIQYASDLHLEFNENSRWLKFNPLDSVGDVLILAGDIGYIGDDNYQHHPFWNWASDNFEQVIVVPGNHELYKYQDINQFSDGWELPIRQNVRAVYNKAIPLTEKTDLLATTLWSHIEKENAYITEQSVSDFHRIMNGEVLLDYRRFNDEHHRCIEFLLNELEQLKDRKIVVISHHVPCLELISPEFVSSRINGAFTADLKDLILSHPQIQYWIYGHSHRNIEKCIGSTKCISNQLGYTFANEHHDFNPNAFIEVE
ncbi:MAG: metallophosphoesterase [Bacteroidales bacterium]|nr:metallophosphoesterase [Bacteroidales bacterium]